MSVRDGARIVLAVMVAGGLSFLGFSQVASAKATVGSAKWCSHHPKQAKTLPACGSSGGGGGGTGGTPAAMTVEVDPSPVTETNDGLVVAVVQIHTAPSFAGDSVLVDSPQLQAACGGVIFFIDLQGPATTANPNIGIDNIEAVVDDDGNSSVVVDADNCAPGPSLISADLVVAPFTTALATLDVNPPNVTPAGVTGYPTTSGSVISGEVETGDTAASGDSDVYAVFEVETDPVYAEQPVEISSAQLEARCLGGWFWGGALAPINGVGVNTGGPEQSILDDDGNALFLFMGTSCAAGSSQVIADVVAGTHPTYTTTFTVNPPAPVI